jgi:hypothetical protein
MRRVVLVLVGALVAGVVSVAPARAAGEAIVAGELRADATIHHIGVVWFVEGDTDLDSSMTLEYRPLGASSWSAAAPAMRADPEVTVDGAPLGINSWGASAMFLDEGSTYELRATVTDPDGGGASRTITVTTRRPLGDGSTTRHVIPGDGGGSGTAADPFRGLQEAADAARPGDLFEVAAGTYAPFQALVSGTASAPIVFRGAAGGASVIDGAGTDRGVVTIGVSDRITSHVVVEGFTIRDGEWGVDAQNTQDIVVAGNAISEVVDGVVNRRGNDQERRQTVCDNRITGTQPWPADGIPSPEGIQLRGWGNVVCHNTVQFFADCISVEPNTGASFGNDVFGNDVAYCVDDGIEVDYNQANVRVWRNRVTNARMGVSVQPISGGPAYLFRNEFFNLESSPIKLNNQPSGVFVIHNTSVMNGNGQSDGSVWNNVVFRNNLILGTRYAFEFTTAADRGFRDFDHDAWGTSRTEEPGGPWFKWDDVRYDRIGDLPPGVEDHGVEVGFDDLVDATLPPTWDVAVVPGAADLRPVSGSPAVDAGETIPNLNDELALSGAPDAGAFELGVDPPSYGPRVSVGSRFVDVAPDHLFFADIEWLAAEGITRGCNPPANDRFCPDDPVTRGQMAAFLVRALDLPAAGDTPFTDIGESVFVDDIAALFAAGITRGCAPTVFCPDDLVTRGQMAAFLVRAGAYPFPGTDPFVDDDTSVFEAEIAALAAQGVTRGCNPPANDRFCPDDQVTRGQMAAFLHRAESVSG